ncbi:MAG: phage virion morphogenesis protein [Candidatus Methanosuratincola sp.]
MQITIQIQSGEVEKLLDRLMNLSYAEPLRDAAVYMKSSVLRNFEIGGRPPWRPLSAKTLMEKLKKGYSPQPLIRTGRLRQSINISVGENEASVLPGVRYGAYHQFGTDRIPARPFLVFQPEDVAVIQQIFANYIARVLGGEGA